MAYSFDAYDSSIVLNGMQNGVADSPYDGISDMRNVDVTTIPGESPVGFATANALPTVPTGNVVSANSSTNVVTYTGLSGLVNGTAVVFGSALGGVSAGTWTPRPSTPSITGTVYWLGNVTPTTFEVYTDVGTSNLLNITGTFTSTVTPINLSQPKHQAYDGTYYWLIDASGLVWSTGFGSYRYTGNLPNNFSNGNGLLFYQASGTYPSPGLGWIFAFSNSSVDVTEATQAPSWNYQWDIQAGGYGSWSATPNTGLRTYPGVNNTHDGATHPDNVARFCDGYAIQTFYEVEGQLFNPASVWNGTTGTYIPATFSYVLPHFDTAQSISYLGLSVLVGGTKNVLYVWDGSSQTGSSYILLPENNVQRIVTVNTNAYLFVGNRGRIYITNSSQAQLFKKLPDHTSGTVEPYFTWGGAIFQRNRLYFSALATTNGSAGISQYGGVWAIDLDTQALWLSNQLSYGTYAGYATTIIAEYEANALGSGFTAGWDNGSSGYGVDHTIGTPYTGGQASIDFDLVPIGTYNKPRNLTRVEVKLSVPLVSGETITVNSRQIFNTQNAGYSQVFTHTYAGLSNEYSFEGPINLENLQWVQIQVVLSSTASSPSYCRFVQARILGLTGQTMATTPILSD